MTLEQIQAQIQALQSYNKSLEAGLPFADYGAYGQDKHRIRWNKEQIAQLEYQAKKLLENN